MNNLVLDATKVTPRVDFDGVSGVLEIEGDSYPEHSLQFYQPLFNWLDDFIQQTETPVTFHFKLSYFNTSSSKCILDILEKLEEANRSGRQVSLYWHYRENDEDIRESGEEFAEDLTLIFQFVKH
ncbi:MAG: DUF1987 domain-containing protein [Acidobacteriota bacterium]